MAKAKKNCVPPEMWARAEELMRDRRLMSCAELDAELASLASSISAEEKTGTGRNRRKNLVDWVKATWTRNGLAVKVRIGAAHCYLWWPVCGRVNDTQLMDTEEVHRCIEAILNRIGKPQTVRCGACGIEASLPVDCPVCGTPYPKKRLP